MTDIYVISDMHLGGVYGTDGGGRGFRINTHVPELAAFVRALTTKAGAERELIINGDMVDFLAERNDTAPLWSSFTQDAEAAVRKMSCLCERDSEFFAALAEFLEAGHKLTILLGNHDIELALPLVRETLASLLGVEGRHDYTLIYTGEAIVRGDALIEHGNRYDAFNVVDYDGLRKIVSLQSRRQTVPAQYNMTPPAGSFMVSQVINPIKEQYRFIDLLKPEGEAVIPVLMALEPKFRDVLGTAALIASKAYKHRMAAAALPSYGGDISSGMTLLEEEIGSDISTMPFALDRTLGMFELLCARSSGDLDGRLPALGRALRALQGDRTNDESVEPERTYLDAAEELTGNGGFRYVVFGHTHKRKRVTLSNGATYFNSGCWVDLMHVPSDCWSTDPAVAAASTREFAAALSSGDLTKWIDYDPTFVRFTLDGDQMASAELCRYTSPASV